MPKQNHSPQEQQPELIPDATRRRKRPKDDPDVHVLLTEFDQLHRQYVHGAPADIVGDRDGGILKHELARRPIAALRILLRLYFELADDYVRRHGFTVPGFKGQMPRLLASREYRDDSSAQDGARETWHTFAMHLGISRHQSYVNYPNVTAAKSDDGKTLTIHATREIGERISRAYHDRLAEHVHNTGIVITWRLT
jgi:hypothetical protein